MGACASGKGVGGSNPGGDDLFLPRVCLLIPSLPSLLPLRSFIPARFPPALADTSATSTATSLSPLLPLLLKLLVPTLPSLSLLPWLLSLFFFWNKIWEAGEVMGDTLACDALTIHHCPCSLLNLYLFAVCN